MCRCTLTLHRTARWSTTSLTRERRLRTRKPVAALAGRDRFHGLTYPLLRREDGRHAERNASVVQESNRQGALDKRAVPDRAPRGVGPGFMIVLTAIRRRLL
jgi:hypothetical protein